jgi:hypothetical protein
LERSDDCTRSIWDIENFENLIVRDVFSTFEFLRRGGDWMVVLGGLGTLRFFEIVDVKFECSGKVWDIVKLRGMKEVGLLFKVLRNIEGRAIAVK